MAVFVLVHGAWHGGWCWRRVAPLLRLAGHEVYTPTLTGIGERAHLISPDIGLSTHVQDVLGVMKCEGLEQVILVGHSYGGMVISGVAERAAARISRLVYLDAFIPRDGECLLDSLPQLAREETLDRARREGEGWRLPPHDDEYPYGVSEPNDARWVRSRLTPQPIRSFTERVRLVDEVARRLPRTFVECTEERWFAEFASRARSEPGWVCREITTGHDAMITKPRELTDVLLECVQ